MVVGARRTSRAEGRSATFLGQQERHQLLPDHLVWADLPYGVRGGSRRSRSRYDFDSFGPEREKRPCVLFGWEKAFEAMELHSWLQEKISKPCFYSERLSGEDLRRDELGGGTGVTQ